MSKAARTYGWENRPKRNSAIAAAKRRQFCPKKIKMPARVAGGPQRRNVAFYLIALHLDYRLHDILLVVYGGLKSLLYVVKGKLVRYNAVNVNGA